MGELEFKREMAGMTMDIDLSGLAKGLYIVNVMNGNKTVNKKLRVCLKLLANWVLIY
jgi:hypothetical protein